MSTRDDLSQRQIARRKQRAAGDRSARMAHELMKLSGAMLAKLELDDELHAAIVKARAVTSLVARRRAERTLAGVLRGVDLVALRERFATVEATGAAEPERLHAAEQWRTRMLDEGIAAIADFPGGDPDHALPKLIAQAQRERTTGKPPGAARALFRHIAEALRAPPPAADAEADDD